YPIGYGEFTVSWTITGGAIWLGPNGEAVSASDAELGLPDLGMSAVSDINKDAETLEPGEQISSSKFINLRFVTPTLVSCKEGEKQYASIQIIGADTIKSVTVMNVS